MKNEALERNPVIFAYKIYKPDSYHHIKIGYTEANPQMVIFDESAWAGLTPVIVLIDSAVRPDGSVLTATEFRDYLVQQGFEELESGVDHSGWIECEPEDVKKAYLHLMGISETAKDMS